MSDDLARALVELADPSICRSHTSVHTGRVNHECYGDRVRVVAIMCEHEHTFDVALCEKHISEVSLIPRLCPHCATVDRHKCRLGVLAVRS